MGAAKLDIEIEQGATFYRKLVFKDANDDEVDITGATLTGQIRKATGQETILASFTCTVLNQVTNKGEAEIKLPPSTTASLPLRKQSDPVRENEVYAYDIFILYQDGTKDRVIYGTAKVSPRVTV